MDSTVFYWSSQYCMHVNIPILFTLFCSSDITGHIVHCLKLLLQQTSREIDFMLYICIFSSTVFCKAQLCHCQPIVAIVRQYCWAKLCCPNFLKKIDVCEKNTTHSIGYFVGVCFIVRSISASTIETVTKDTTSNKHDIYALQYCTKWNAALAVLGIQ